MEEFRLPGFTAQASSVYRGQLPPDYYHHKWRTGWGSQSARPVLRPRTFRLLCGLLSRMLCGGLGHGVLFVLVTRIWDF
jgi:hypothetical protein